MVSQEVEQLKKANNMLEQIIRSIPISIAITSWYDGRILWCNEKTATLFGGTVESLIGRRIHEFYRDDKQREKMLHTLEKEGQIRYFEMTAVTEDGEELELRGSVNPIEYNEEAAVIGIMENITAQKEAQKMFERTKHAENLVDAVSGLAHDFGNYVGTTKLFLESMIVETPEGTAQADKQRKALESVEDSIALVRKMREYTGEGALDLHAVSPQSIIDQCVMHGQTFAYKSTVISCSVQPDLPMITVDPVAIKRVLSNLIINACHAIGDKPGAIDIMALRRSVVADELDSIDNYSGGTLQPGAYVSICVQDTGAGISENDLEKIFEPRFTTKANKGTGMGLASAQGIIRQHDGGILVESVVGEGTKFTLLLPAAPSESD